MKAGSLGIGAGPAGFRGTEVALKYIIITFVQTAVINYFEKFGNERGTKRRQCNECLVYIGRCYRIVLTM